MPISANALAQMADTTLEQFIDKGKVWKQYVQNRPLLKALNANAGSFAGGNQTVSWGVKAGTSGNVLAGYSGDDVVAYSEVTDLKRARASWREHHIGVKITHSELKIDGIDISDDGADENATRPMEGREEIALANRLDEVMDTFGEDYAASLDALLHGDGTGDTKAIAGIKAFILDAPATGTTFGLARTNTWWRNRAATAAYGAAGGQGAITSNPANGGALLQFLESEWRQLNRYGQANIKIFAGSAFLDAYNLELRANGRYSDSGYRQPSSNDGAMADGGPWFKGRPMAYDPKLDDLGLSKRAYFLDLSKGGVRLLYMNGQRMKKHSPERPYDRYVYYKAVTMTGVLIAKRLNSSGVYDIA